MRAIACFLLALFLSSGFFGICKGEVWFEGYYPQEPQEIKLNMQHKQPIVGPNTARPGCKLSLREMGPKKVNLAITVSTWAISYQNENFETWLSIDDQEPEKLVGTFEHMGTAMGSAYFRHYTVNLSGLYDGAHFLKIRVMGEYYGPNWGNYDCEGNVSVITDLDKSGPIIEVANAQNTIYIRSNGSVEGTDKIQRNGNVYTFTGDINGSLIVEIDDVVIDGANYSLQGNGTGVGIHVPNNGNLEIKNVKINDFKFAIYFDYYSKNRNIISGNTLTNNTYYGIYMSSSHNNSIFGNYIEDSGTGIQLAESYNNTIFQNKIIGNEKGIGFGSGGGSSTVFHNLIADNGYAFTFWASSHNTIYGNNLVDNTNQVHAWSSSNNWNSFSIGNFWSDYNGTDINEDGIGDTPYVIITSPEDYDDTDSYPLMEPVDDTLIPEFPSWTILPLVLAITLFSIVVKRKLTNKSSHFFDTY